MFRLLCLVLSLELGMPLMGLMAQLREDAEEATRLYYRRLRSSQTTDIRDLRPAKFTGSSFPNVPVTDDDSRYYESETSIAVHPLNPNLIVGGSNVHPGDFSFFSKVTFVRSEDGGSTWGLTFMPHEVRNRTIANGVDPMLVFDDAGNLYYSYLVLDTVRSAIVVDKSPDVGTTWTRSYVLRESLDPNWVDKPVLACDLTKSLFQNSLYAAWKNLDSSDSYISFSRLRAGDTTFSTPIRFPNSEARFPGGIVVGPDGTIYLAWSYGFYATDIELVRSTDGGNTFSTAKHVAYVLNSTSWKPLKGVISTHSLPSIAADNSLGPHRGNVYIVWDDQRDGDSDVLFSRSTDKGETWSPPFGMNDDPLKNGKDQFLPGIAVDTTGKITVVFYDSRNDPDNLLTDIYVAQSTDGGGTWVNFKLSDTAVDPRLAVWDGWAFGDYIGVASCGNVTFPLWWDARTGDTELFTARIDDRPTQNITAYEFVNTNLVSPGDTIDLAVSVRNHFSPVTGLTVTLATNDTDITFLRNNVSFGPVDSMTVVTNQNDPFVFTVASNARPHIVTVDAIVQSQSSFGTLSFTESLSFPIASLTAVRGEPGIVPSKVQLFQNFPNPFNPSTTIRFELPRRAMVKLTVFNLLGEEISRLVSNEVDAGAYSILFDGSHSASGVYFYRLQVGEHLQVRKMLLVS